MQRPKRSRRETPQRTPIQGEPEKIVPTTAKKAPTSICPSRPMLKMPALVVNDPPSADEKDRRRRAQRRDDQEDVEETP